MSLIENFEGMLAGGTDNAMLRFGLGQAYIGENNLAKAIEHLHAAVKHDPTYSAAWKLLGKALAQDEQLEAAASTYKTGIDVAEANGDKQAVKEMTVFLKRINKLLQKSP